MFRIIGFAALVVGYCSLSSGCCCCADMNGFIKAPNPAQRAEFERQRAEFERQRQEQQQQFKGEPGKKFAAQNNIKYNARTGAFSKDDQQFGFGFSGTGNARNAPEFAAQLKTGPIPLGVWRVTSRTDDPKTGEPTFELQHVQGGHVKGRVPDGETFTIHADTRPGAGESGIAAPRAVRDQINVGNVIRVH